MKRKATDAEPSGGGFVLGSAGYCTLCMLPALALVSAAHAEARGQENRCRGRSGMRRPGVDRPGSK